LHDFTSFGYHRSQTKSTACHRDDDRYESEGEEETDEQTLGIVQERTERSWTVCFNEGKEKLMATGVGEWQKTCCGE
jgi:hypothetical protein